MIDYLEIKPVCSLLLLLVLYGTTLTYRWIKQVFFGIFYTSRSCLDYMLGGVVTYSLGTSYRYVKLNRMPEFSFLRNNWFDCGFLNLYIHEVRISKIRLYLLVFYFSCYFIIIIILFRLVAYKKGILFTIWVFKIQKKEEI